MRYIFCCLLFCSLSLAKDKIWQEATILDLQTIDGGSQMVIVPIGTGLYGASVPRNRSTYRLQSGDYTYIIPNYCDGVWTKPWLHLTVGTKTKIAVESSSRLYIVDDDGKERKVSIFGRIKTGAGSHD